MEPAYKVNKTVFSSILAATYAEAIIDAKAKLNQAKAELQRLGDECEHWEHTDPVPQTINSREKSIEGFYSFVKRQECLVSYCKTCGVKRTEFLEDNSVEYGAFWI